MDEEQYITYLDPHCSEVVERIAASALGADLPAQESAQVLLHLTGCAHCRQRLNEYATIADLLPLQAPLVAPPADLRERIMVAAQHQRSQAPPRPQPHAQARQPQPPPWQWPSIPWRRALTPALGLLAAVLLVWGVGLYGQLQQQYARSAQQQAVAVAAFGNPDAQERLLVPTSAAPEAWGRVLISPSAPAVALYVKNLPPLPAGHTYQVWLVQHGQYLSVGTFTVDPHGRAWQLMQPATPIAAPHRLTITVEPTGGSAQPTGPEYLGTQL